MIRGGGTPRKIEWGCAARLAKNPYHIYDQNLRCEGELINMTRAWDKEPMTSRTLGGRSDPSTELRELAESKKGLLQDAYLKNPCCDIKMSLLRS